MSNVDRNLSVSVNEATVDALFTDVNQCQLPGAAVGIAVDGRPVYRKGFGLASMELPIVLSPAIRMRIGSTSKQFAAFAFMRLCEEGLATPDDPVGKYLPELNPVCHAVTMRQLMGNISGLRDACDLVHQIGSDGRRVTTGDLLSVYREVHDVNAAPGTAFIYNNGGWVILCALMERITKQPLEEVFSERVFRPIGMNDTHLRRWDADYVPNSASCHRARGSGRYIRVETTYGLDYVGAGSIATTVDDMLRWCKNMADPSVGSADTWKAMLTPQQLRNGTSSGYGQGLSSFKYRGVDAIEHSGGGAGSNAQMLRVPSVGLDVVVISNRSDKNASTYAERIVDACISGLDASEPSYEGPFPTGVFLSPSSGRVIELVRGQTSLHGEAEVPICAFDGFRAPALVDVDGTIRICGVAAPILKVAVKMIGDPARPARLELDHWGNRDELVRAGPPSSTEVELVIGEYSSSILGSTAIIAVEGDRATLRMAGRFGSASHIIEAIGPGIFRSAPVEDFILPPWGTLVFGEGKRSFAFSNYMTRRLTFTRRQ